MKVGLVLGAGGVLGGAWLTGALDALAAETGWDPGSADRIVGTSAGSMVGAFLAAGVKPAYMVERTTADQWTQSRNSSAGSVYRVHRGFPGFGPGSWPLAWSGLRAPQRYRPAALAAAWLPRGVLSTQPLVDAVRQAVPKGWGPHPGLWVVACDFVTGRRVVFGRDGAPHAPLADAVAASCAIPGFYRPVEIDGREYVDGGVWSPSNLDLLSNCGLDRVICLNPTSSLDAPEQRGVGERVAGMVRRQAGRRLGWEARRVRDAGVEVVLIQPTAEDLARMGTNLMRRRGRRAVVETARHTWRERLRRPELRRLLEGMAA
jgi:NTE family protein